MTDPPNEADDLDALLTPPVAAPRPELRAELLRATERHLARSRWSRRVARVAGIAAVFVVGALIGWVAKPDIMTERTFEISRAPQVLTIPVVIPLVGSPATPQPEALTPQEAELRAEQEDDRGAAANLYRQAGDGFLRMQDYPNATRCYRLYLSRADDNALSLVPGDSWLLVSIKNAAFKEKTDVLPKSDG